MGNIRYCLNIAIKKLFIIVIPYDCDIIQHSVFIYKVKNMENCTFSQSVYHFWNYMVKKLKANIMAELIWSTILPSHLSLMTTAEGGNPSQWTGGMRRHLSYEERLLQYSLQEWLCEHETYSHQKQVLHWLIIKRDTSRELMATSFMLTKFFNHLERIFNCTKCCVYKAV